MYSATGFSERTHVFAFARSNRKKKNQFDRDSLSSRSFKIRIREKKEFYDFRPILLECQWMYYCSRLTDWLMSCCVHALNPTGETRRNHTLCVYVEFKKTPTNLPNFERDNVLDPARKLVHNKKTEKLETQSSPPALPADISWRGRRRIAKKNKNTSSQNVGKSRRNRARNPNVWYRAISPRRRRTEKRRLLL